MMGSARPIVTLVWLGILAFPPRHPSCASETAPAIDFKNTRERAAAVLDLVRPAFVRFTYGDQPKLQFGSGVIVSASGHVVVSGPVNYVIDDALLDLQLIDGRSVSGKALGWSSEFGVGLLKITDAGPWPHVELSKRAEAGEVCVALGYIRNSPGTETAPGIRLGIVTKVSPGRWLTTSYRSPFNAHPIFNLDGKLLGLHHSSSSGHDSIHASARLIDSHWDELAAGSNLDRVRLAMQRSDSDGDSIRSERVSLEVIASAKKVSVRISDIGAEQSRVSGVIVSRDGYVITCGHHRCLPGTNMTVTLEDGRRVNAIVVGTNLVSDVGVLKITEAGTWPHAELGYSSAVREGEQCVAIGYPTHNPSGEPWVYPTTVAGPAMMLPMRDAWKSQLWTTGSSLGKGGVSGCGVFDTPGRVTGVLLGGNSGAGAKARLRIARIELFRKNWEVLTSGVPVQVADPDRVAEVADTLNRLAAELSADESR